MLIEELSERYDVWAKDYDEFDKQSWGGKLALSYPIWDFSRVYGSYLYDNARVSDIRSDASQMIKDQEGKLVTSSVSTTLRRDSRDHTYHERVGQQRDRGLCRGPPGRRCWFHQNRGKHQLVLPPFLGVCRIFTWKNRIHPRSRRRVADLRTFFSRWYQFN